MFQRKLKGLSFSLDLAVVIVCISILISAAIIGCLHYVKSGKINKAKAECACLALAVSHYTYDLQNSYPENTPGQCFPSNLVALESKHTASGKGPWLAGNSMNKSGTDYLDPWGRAYVFSHGSDADGRFVVYSKGPDGNGSVSVDGTASNNGIGAAGGFSQ